MAYVYVNNEFDRVDKCIRLRDTESNVRHNSSHDTKRKGNLIIYSLYIPYLMAHKTHPVLADVEMKKKINDRI